jgi:hypothetical protein
MKHGSITSIQNKKTEHAVEALWHVHSEEIQESAISLKMMASFFWDNQGIIMIDYLEQGRSINGTYCANKLRRLRQEIARKRKGKLTQCVLLPHDNATAHTSQVAAATNLLWL